MKNSINCLWAVVVAVFSCVLPGHSRADTIYVASYYDETIRQYATNGTGSIFAHASLFGPQGEAFDKAGNLYVANNIGNTIEKFTTNGVATVFAADPGDNSILSAPEGLAFDKAGNLYAANDGYNTNGVNTIEEFNTNGVASVFAADDGSGDILNGPEGLAFDTNGNLYAANDGDYIEEFSTNGAPWPFGDSSYLNDPVGVAFDTADNLYVANSLPASDGPEIVKYDTSGDGSVFATNGLDYPEFITFDTASNLYVANSGNSNSIEKFDTVGDGSVFATYGLDYPFGLAFDQSGNLFANSDAGQFIEELDTNAVASRFATTTIQNPQGMGFDSAGNLYVANAGSGAIEKFDTNGNASLFAFPYGIYGLAIDSSNNVYVDNFYTGQILKYTPAGSSGGYSIFATNGLTQPQDIAFDSLGNLYAVNSISNTIEKFDKNGNGSVFATISPSYTFGPGIAIDSANNVYALTNWYGTGIGKFSPAGVLSPFANDPGTSYTFSNPQGMAFDSAGNLYVADYYNGTVEKYDTNGNGSVFASGLQGPTSVVVQRNAVFIPVLVISLKGINVVLSWSTAAANYNLKSVTNIISTNWLPVSGTLYTNGGNLMLTNLISGPARFFRLSNP